MPHHSPLIATIAIGLALAFIFGLIAQRLRLPQIAGYLVAGVLCGPFTPGLQADATMAAELAEIGVILLMFGVGLHFSLRDLLSVKSIAVPGALGQIAVATLLGMVLAHWFGWPWGGGFLFGLALSVASTVVLLRALQERRLVETERGRIAVGWLIVEDLVMVLALVLVPTLSELLGGKPSEPGAYAALAGRLGIAPLWLTLGLTLLKVGLFMWIMLVIGRRVIPWTLHYVAHTGSRELFRLSVLAIALGVAFGSATLFGVSFALGAFFAGMVMSESQLSSQAAREILPLRDAFAVLFFVSVGMLFDPTILVSAPLAVLATVAIIVLGKSIAAYGIVRVFGYSNAVALTISTSLAQIGEFSFILAVLGVKLEILPETGRDLLVAGAIISILLNPLLFHVLDRFAPHEEAEDAPSPGSAEPAPVIREEAPTTQIGHAVVIGHGGVGRRVVDALLPNGVPLLVVDEEADVTTELRARGIESFTGAGGERPLLERLNLAQARWLIIAIPQPFETGHIVETARAANPDLQILARASSEEEAEYLRGLGANLVLIGQEEIARAMTRSVLQLRPA